MENGCKKSTKVTELNIFSTGLSVETMKEYTRGGKGCAENGDDLSWEEMQWELHSDYW